MFHVHTNVWTCITHVRSLCTYVYTCRSTFLFIALFMIFNALLSFNCETGFCYTIFISGHVDLLHSFWCLQWIYTYSYFTSPVMMNAQVKRGFKVLFACPYSRPLSSTSDVLAPLNHSQFYPGSLSPFIFSHTSLQFRNKRTPSAATRI